MQNFQRVLFDFLRESSPISDSTRVRNREEERDGLKGDDAAGKKRSVFSISLFKTVLHRTREEGFAWFLHCNVNSSPFVRMSQTQIPCPMRSEDCAMRVMARKNNGFNALPKSNARPVLETMLANYVPPWPYLGPALTKGEEILS